MSGIVLPGGRGQELHGVQQSGTPDLIDDIEMGDPVVIPPEKDEPDPIPVRIIASSRRELRRWRVFRHTFRAATDLPVCLLGQDERRTAVQIRNARTAAGATFNNVVWIAPEQHLANSLNGWPCDVNNVLQFSPETAVYAAPDPNATDFPIELGILVEYTTDVQA